MTDLDKTRSDPKGQLWDQLEDVRAVMLGSPDPTQHMQPMAPMVARDEEKIWFYTKRSSDLAKAVAGSSGKVHMCVVGEDDDYHACLHGTLTLSDSKAHIDRFWSSVVAAWFEHGKDDPELVMLCFEPTHARAWGSADNSFRFGWEIAKANMTDSVPDVGVTADIAFN